MASNETCMGAPGTINPADLMLPQNDGLLLDGFDINALCSGAISMPSEPVPMPSDPIWINPSATHSLQQPEKNLPYTGWEQLTPNGDLNYSSYGSSPADHTLEYQLMVQRFGHYNIGMARGANPGLSRTTSFSSFEQHPQTPAGYAPRPRRKRGRLLADISSPGPETVYEDSDSHHSWTAADNVESWSAHLRERLSEFRRNKQRVSIITSQLQTRQRRKVHSMANLLGLSHTSLGSGRQKRVLICKCELTRSKAQTSEKRWNPSRNNWTPGTVDPRIVLFDLVSPKLSVARLQECLSEAGLPLPVKLTIDCFNPSTPAVIQPVATAYAMFQTANDAAMVLLFLDGTKPSWNGIDAELECDYVNFPPGFHLNSKTLEAFNALPDAIRAGRARVREGKIYSAFSSHTTANSACYSDTDSGSDIYPTTPNRVASFSTSPTMRHLHDSFSSRSNDHGYVSAGSPLHSDHSGNANVQGHSQHRKRKRVPKISGGYVCTFQGCDRVFDRDGDRRKHEKNHGGERPHVCSKCKKGFLFPKDLRRHMIVHSITSLPSSNEGDRDEGDGAGDGEGDVLVDDEARENTNRNREIQALSSSPPLSEEQFRRLYGEARPRDRRISRISSFGT